MTIPVCKEDVSEEPRMNVPLLKVISEKLKRNKPLNSMELKHVEELVNYMIDGL